MFRKFYFISSYVVVETNFWGFRTLYTIVVADPQGSLSAEKSSSNWWTPDDEHSGIPEPAKEEEEGLELSWSEFSPRLVSVQRTNYLFQFPMRMLMESLRGCNDWKYPCNFE